MKNRTALAAAISEHQAAAAALASAQASEEAARRWKSEARDEITAAEEALAEAKAGVVTTYAASAGTTATPPLTRVLKQVRARVEDANDVLEAATEAHQRLAAALPDPQRRVEKAQASVATEAKKVLVTAAAQMFAELVPLQIDVINRRKALAFVLRNGAEHLEPLEANRMKQLLMTDFVLPGIADPDHLWRHISGDAPWRDALARLQEDASAPLPI